MKKKKLIKLLIYTFIVLFFLTVIIVVIKHPKNYTVNYSINDFSIEEQYNKEQNHYSFKIKINDIPYNFMYQNKYIAKKELIKDIKLYEKENYKCVLPISNYFTKYPLCYDGKTFIDYDLIEDKDESFFKRESPKNQNENYKNIEIINSQENNYLIWASKGYIFLNDKEIKESMFLERDSYYNNLSYQIDNLVITPNYDENYTFSKIFITDLKTGKTKTWKFNFKINFNSYYLGHKDNTIYLFDRKEKLEYAITPKKKKIEIVNKGKEFPKIWNDGWEEVSTTKLANEDYHFTHNDIYKFDNNDSKLHLKMANEKEILISKKNISKIVYTHQNHVYYLVEDTLYEFSLIDGERALLKYNEWNFNNNNAIFIYKKK